MRVITLSDKRSLLASLQRLAFFQKWESDELERILDDPGVRVQAYRMGEFFIRQEGRDASLYVMLLGRASVVRTGSSIPLAELSVGQFFGEVSFLTAEPRGTNVIVHGSSPVDSDSIEGHLSEALGIRQSDQSMAESTVVLRLEPGVMERLQAATRLTLLEHFIATLVQRLDVMNERIVQLTGQAPMLSIDVELSNLFGEADALPSPGGEAPPFTGQEREALTLRFLKQLFQCQKEMNDLLLQMEGVSENP
ncbi:MAG: cyclic nucleotide-binding domain-containing protein [Magnetococcales bacterium]|nr:cyclic nucleotide-binding domain-containing protein [Magnetococcales bacterium]